MSALKDLPELARDGSNLNAVMAAVLEAIQTFRGYRGNNLDRALTVRDLSSMTFGTTTVTTGTGTTGATGATGAPGTRTAILEMYKWSATDPTSFPYGVSDYTWATGQFTAPPTLNGWSMTPTTPVPGQTLYVTRQVYVDNSDSTHSMVTWVASASYPYGIAGINGTNGTDGTRTAYLEVYRWKTVQPTTGEFPTGTSTYTWATGAFTAPTVPNGWSLVPPAPTQGQTLWAVSVSFSDNLTTATSSVTWNSTTPKSIGYAGVDATVSVSTTPPPTAEGLTVSAGMSYLYINCGVPPYSDHDRTIVYGAKWPTGGVEPTFASAVELYTFQGTFSAYATDPLQRWCIWIKWRNTSGLISVNEAGGVHGTQATTGLNPTAMIASFGSAWIDSAMIANLSAAQLTAGDGTIGSSLKSSNYVAGVSGWMLDQTGTVKSAKLDIGNALGDRFTFDSFGAKFYGSLNVMANSDLPVSINGTFDTLTGWYAKNALATAFVAPSSALIVNDGTSNRLSVPIAPLYSAKFPVLGGETYTLSLDAIFDATGSSTSVIDILYETNSVLNDVAVGLSTTHYSSSLTVISNTAVTGFTPSWFPVTTTFTVPAGAYWASITING
jgi:hypothetical protein